MTKVAATLFDMFSQCKTDVTTIILNFRTWRSQLHVHFFSCSGKVLQNSNLKRSRIQICTDPCDRQLFKAGGDPSTWFPPGKLVEQIKKIIIILEISFVRQYNEIFSFFLQFTLICIFVTSKYNFLDNCKEFFICFFIVYEFSFFPKKKHQKLPT